MDRQLLKEQEDKDAMLGRFTLTCEICGHTGEDVHEYPYYDRTLGRDSSQYQCDDINACLDRKFNGLPMRRY